MYESENTAKRYRIVAGVSQVFMSSWTVESHAQWCFDPANDERYVDTVFHRRHMKICLDTVRLDLAEHKVVVVLIFCVVCVY